jgi:hypothetical protein
LVLYTVLRAKGYAKKAIYFCFASSHLCLQQFDQTRGTLARDLLKEVLSFCREGDGTVKPVKRMFF